jgi:anti-sigma B factor antagonist
VKISTRQSGNATVFDVTGDIDLQSSPELRKTLLDAARQGPSPRLVVNLQGVKYVDSSGVAALVEGLKSAMGQGGKFVLYGLGPAVREMLKLTQLITVFQVAENEGDAVRRAS